MLRSSTHNRPAQSASAHPCTSLQHSQSSCRHHVPDFVGIDCAGTRPTQPTRCWQPSSTSSPKMQALGVGRHVRPSCTAWQMTCWTSCQMTTYLLRWVLLWDYMRVSVFLCCYWLCHWLCISASSVILCVLFDISLAHQGKFRMGNADGFFPHKSPTLMVILLSLLILNSPFCGEVCQGSVFHGHRTFSMCTPGASGIAVVSPSTEDYRHGIFWNAAACIVTRMKSQDGITPVLQSGEKGD